MLVRPIRLLRDVTTKKQCYLLVVASPLNITHGDVLKSWIFLILRIWIFGEPTAKRKMGTGGSLTEIRGKNTTFALH